MIKHTCSTAQLSIVTWPVIWPVVCQLDHARCSSGSLKCWRHCKAYLFFVVVVMQDFGSSCDRIKKKGKKSRKSGDDVASEAGAQSAFPVVTNGVKSGDVQKRKSGKCKSRAKHMASKVDNGINSGSEAEHTAGKKKKSATGCSVNGHEIKSRDVGAASEKADKSDAVSASGLLNDASLKSNSVDKKRKRKSKAEKKVGLNSSDNSQCVDEHHSKKLKTDSENLSDKTVVSSGDVEPGAFENYRISQTLVDKLQCMSTFSFLHKFFCISCTRFLNMCHPYYC